MVDISYGYWVVLALLAVAAWVYTDNQIQKWGAKKKSQSKMQEKIVNIISLSTEPTEDWPKRKPTFTPYRPGKSPVAHKATKPASKPPAKAVVNKKPLMKAKK